MNRGVSSNLTKTNSHAESKSGSNQAYLNKYFKEREDGKSNSSLMHNSKSSSTVQKTNAATLGTSSYSGYGITKNSKPLQKNLMGGTLSQEEETKTSVIRKKSN